MALASALSLSLHPPQACILAPHPTAGLTGLDHWEAAREVGSQWAEAQPDLRAELQARGVAAPARLPVLGLGHSLGCKLLLLLGSEPTTGTLATLALAPTLAPAPAPAPSLAPSLTLALGPAPSPSPSPNPSHHPRPGPYRCPRRCRLAA